MLIRGRIVEERKNYCCVDTEIGVVRSLIKGIIKKQENRCIVGDFVTVDIFNTDTLEGIIRELHPRKNQLHKPAVANIDQVLFILTYKEPILELEFVDRFLFLTGTFS